MDTSETYINMCRQAKELQEMWEPKEGDWFVHEMRIETLGSLHATLLSNDIIECDYDAEDWQKIRINDCVWLPRIDQLIELSGMGWYNFMLFGVRIADSAGLFMQPMLEHFLMCLMHYKYHKKWNGEDWI